jgi:DNA adenine methylase
MSTPSRPARHGYISPLRYPGGKGKLANFVKLLLQTNKLHDVHYVEPYAGGASVGLSLLFEEYARHIHINDVNRSVHAFWHSVLEQPDDLCRLIRDTPVTVKEWHRQKATQEANRPSLLDLGFSTFFLNRTNRSGIIGAGIIGGKEQTGAWKIDARYTKADLILRIQKIARYKSRITLTRLDAEELLSPKNALIPKGAFLYLDPPYFIKGQGLYEHFYHEEDHARIAKLVSKLKAPWMVSYDFHPRLMEFYASFDHTIYQLSYSAQDRYKGSEVIFFSPMLSLPKVPSPAKLPHSWVTKGIPAGV